MFFSVLIFKQLCVYHIKKHDLGECFSNLVQTTAQMDEVIQSFTVEKGP